MNESNFYSIDRLLDFGIGMAMAQQMINVMNTSMKSMEIPGSPAVFSRPMQIFVAIDGKAAGPFSEAEFRRLSAERKIEKSTLAWMPGQADWRQIADMPALLALIALTPPPLP